MKSLNCNQQLIDLDAPKVMGILNLTPDSFFDGGKYNDFEKIRTQVQKMCDEGATFIDVGGYSSRPGATHISEEEELNRILPIVAFLKKEFTDILISVDTFRSKVAKATLDAGACMINDISAGSLDREMFKTIANYQVPYVIMHMQGTPQNMQKNPSYENLLTEIIYYFSEKIYDLHNLGVNDIIIDPGFGFGKTLEHNYELLSKLDLLKSLEKPILSGLSRKSMLYKPFDSQPENALNATTAANTMALLHGSSILRVHDVKEAVECIKIVELTKKNT